MNKPVRPRSVILKLSLLVFLATGALPSQGAQTHTQFNKQKTPTPKKGNLIDLFFGSAPPMPTQRGTLIIDAFNDRNGNQHRDPGENDLSGKISCKLGKIDYQIPAFIPGLNLGKDYSLVCGGKDFVPDYTAKNIFVEHRGQIIRLDLPCRPVAAGKHPPSPKRQKATSVH